MNDQKIPTKSETRPEYEYELKPGRTLPSRPFKFTLKVLEFEITSAGRFNHASMDPGVSIASVPVVQLFGTTDRDESVVLTVHNFFPYVYVPYLGPSQAEGSKEYLAEFRQQLDEFETLKTKGGLITSTQIVKRLPFYGYHPRVEKFVKEIGFCIAFNSRLPV